MPPFGCKSVALMQKDERTYFASPDFPKSFKTKKKRVMDPKLKWTIDRLRDKQLRKRTYAPDFPVTVSSPRN
jgi:hypothetical protein